MIDHDKEWGRALLERSTVGRLELFEEELYGLTAPAALRKQRQVNFLRAFSRRGIVSDGCQVADISRATVSYWRDEEEWFEDLYQAAILEACDNLEAEAHRRAVEGIDEPVIWQGMPTTVKDATTGTERLLTTKKYSDPLLTLLLKGNMPEKYRENVKHDHGLGQATGVLIVPGAIDAKTWAEQAKAQQEKYAGNTGDAPAGD
jgi:hypothetical protein